METELRTMQLIELDMLKTLIQLFQKHNIRYYALGGTLLGAVRHKGFIPWDDDIDVGVPRPDYERFLKIAETELPENLKVVYFRNMNEKRPIYASQVQNQDTVIVQHAANKDNVTKVWIDVFPLDGMPDNSLMRKIQSFHLLYRRMRIQFSMFDENVHQHRKNRPWYEKALIELYRKTKIGSSSDPYDMMEKMDRALTKYDYEKCGYLINFMGAWKLKEMFPKSVYGKGKEYPFEDITITGPEDADYVLTQMYGDYRTPIRQASEQKEHHSIEILRLK